MCKLARSAGAIDDPGDRAEIEIYERDAVEVLGHGRTPSKRKFVVQATLQNSITLLSREQTMTRNR